MGQIKKYAQLLQECYEKGNIKGSVTVFIGFEEQVRNFLRSSRPGVGNENTRNLRQIKYRYEP